MKSWKRHNLYVLHLIGSDYLSFTKTFKTKYYVCTLNQPDGTFLSDRK